MSTTVFPESGDQITEAAWTAHNLSLTVADAYRLSGYTLSAGTGLNANVAAGTAYVQGYHIVSDATQAVAVTASNTNYIWLAEDGTLSANTTGTNPGDDLLLGTAVADGSGVTSVSHQYNIANAQNALIIKASDETVNNSTTFQNDDELKFTVADGSQWEITCLLLLDAGSNTPQIKFQWDVSGGSIAQYNFAWGPATSSGVSRIVPAFAAGAVVVDLGIGTDSLWIFKSTVFVTTGGTLNLQWAQSTADASDTKVAANSVLVARRIFG